ncbi:hypothetical protein [Shimwellia blattae]|uniref:Uncharacterized protein n=1 Tax=Shimwellia blattae (strain ATCC 29907 / DSM 4481 / JCM 1650 / NBRC 105725 / CDC 9005-74) TaxID=630626 RepID=I2B8G2_SHIBC|nr:hypothetical protein [Shimwellia blattae]AFJ46816.1 hypothetical protein EBL_c17220 [Shimwellia blattae DSM 4481 = NBRC 105725]GAB82956.1 hypothetical protein EB105725_38_00040 [Shimwellia blattae DSM 4481 = NBRC 105725]VDY64295.1 Uncharacterised protein [Shimwellia blattae]VEC22420.1 Uncharacterised protein [Shimwellia blattae]
MEHNYLLENEKPEFDTRITAWLNSQSDIPWGKIPYPVALCHNGKLYREVIAQGLGEYVSLTAFLRSIGLENMLSSRASLHQYGAVFATPETCAAYKNPQALTV